jgi:hypothetical protein
MKEPQYITLPYGLTYQLEVESLGTRGPVAMEAAAELVGCVNADVFLGKPPGTVRLDGIVSNADDEGIDLCRFSYRELPWNQMLHPDARWAEARDARGKLAYEVADFSGLPTDRVQ